MLNKSGFFSPSRSDILNESAPLDVHIRRMPEFGSDHVSGTLSSYKETERMDNENSFFQEASFSAKISKTENDSGDHNETISSGEVMIQSEDVWEETMKKKRQNKKAVAYLQELKSHFPELIYAKTDNSCQSLNRPGSRGVWNYFDIEGAKKKLFTSGSKAVDVDWLERQYTELTFENGLNIEILSRHSIHDLSLAWWSDTTPRTIFIELSPPINTDHMTKLQPLSFPVCFNFIVKLNKPEKQVYTFKVLNALADFQNFTVNHRENSGVWQRCIEGKATPIEDCWEFINKKVRHRAANCTVLEWKYSPERIQEGFPLVVEFSLLPQFDYAMLKKLIFRWNQSTPLNLKTLAPCFYGIPSKYLIFHKGKPVQLSKIQNKNLLIFNFWEDTWTSSMLFFFKGLMNFLLDPTKESSQFCQESYVVLIILPPFPHFIDNAMAVKSISRIVKKARERNKIEAFIGFKSIFQGDYQNCFFEREIGDPALTSYFIESSSPFFQIVKFFEGFYPMFSASTCR